MSRTVNADNPKHWFIPYNGKIADITHADTNKHNLTLANAAGTGAIAGETRKIIAVIIGANRVGGTGEFYGYANEGANVNMFTWFTFTHTLVIANGTQRLQYSLSVAGDDFDLFCFGYVVEA